MLRLRHVIALVVVGTALSGCYPPPLSSAPEVDPTVTNAYDGTYRGTVETTFIAQMAHPDWCQTDSQVVVQISNGILTYAQPHPGYPDAPVVTYTATVTNDSNLSGESDKNGTITGQIVSMHLTATLDGLGCNYALTAERT